MEIFIGTDIGLQRTENQDRVKFTILNEISAFAVLCDGMGGENAGSEASESASEVIFDRITKVYRRDYSDEAVKNLMIGAIATANSVILDSACSDPEKKGMGTTCVAVLLRGTKLHVVSAGDSRVYVVTPEIIYQVTRDHSVVMQKYENGEITKDELRTHPQRNFITKALGIPFDVDPDYFELELGERDRVMLCSDGLSTYVDESKMFEVLSQYKGQELIDRLIKCSLGAGGKDNITVAVIEIND
jgi:protein phosphatase